MLTTGSITHNGKNDCEDEFKAYLSYSKKLIGHGGAIEGYPYISNLCSVRNRPIHTTNRKRDRYGNQRRAPPRLVGSFLMARVLGD